MLLDPFDWSTLPLSTSTSEARDAVLGHGEHATGAVALHRTPVSGCSPFQGNFQYWPSDACAKKDVLASTAPPIAVKAGSSPTFSVLTASSTSGFISSGGFWSDWLLCLLVAADLNDVRPWRIEYLSAADQSIGRMQPRQGGWMLGVSLVCMYTCSLKLLM